MNHADPGNIHPMPDQEIIGILRRAIADGHRYVICIDYAADLMVTTYNVEPKSPGTTEVKTAARMLERHARMLRESEK